MEDIRNKCNRAAAGEKLHVGIVVSRGQKTADVFVPPTEVLAGVEPVPENGIVKELFQSAYVDIEPIAVVQAPLNDRIEHIPELFFKEQTYQPRDRQHRHFRDDQGQAFGSFPQHYEKAERV